MALPFISALTLVLLVVGTRVTGSRPWLGATLLAVAVVAGITKVATSIATGSTFFTIGYVIGTVAIVGIFLWALRRALLSRTPARG